jgi:hypothetical protein
VRMPSRVAAGQNLALKFREFDFCAHLTRLQEIQR